MRSWKIALSICYWFSVLAILWFTYSTDDYRFGVITGKELVAAYLELTILVWTLGMIVWWLAAKIAKNGPFLAGIFAFAISVLLFWGYAIFQFREPPEITEPITPSAMDSHFFSEFNGITFAFVSGPLCALFLAVIVAVDRDRMQFKSR